jgi:antitoxin ParD1/3/4
MSKPYSPGPEADAIISRQVAKGNFASPDDVVRAGVRLLEEREAELAELRRLIGEGDADISAGRLYVYEDAAELAADIAARGEARLSKKS